MTRTPPNDPPAGQTHGAGQRAVDLAWLLIRMHPKYMHVRRLHAMLYYVQVTQLTRSGTGAFDDQIIAAPAGPTVPAVCRALAFPHDALSVHLNRHGRLHEAPLRPRLIPT